MNQGSVRLIGQNLVRLVGQGSPKHLATHAPYPAPPATARPEDLECGLAGS